MTAMVALSYVICLSLGAIIGLLSVGLCSAASDNANHRSIANSRPMVNKRLGLSV
jgi:hypothetical protein